MRIDLNLKYIMSSYSEKSTVNDVTWLARDAFASIITKNECHISQQDC